jgi:hypothetical protein
MLADEEAEKLKPKLAREGARYLQDALVYVRLRQIAPRIADA